MNTINWGDSAWKHLSLIGGEEVVSLSRAKVYVYSDSVLCLGKMREPTIEYCLEGLVDVVQKFITTFWAELMVNQWNSSGIFSRIHHIAALQQSPRVPVKNERRTRRFHRTDHLMGSPRRVDNTQRRTREGPELACV